MSSNKPGTLWIGDLEPFMDETFLKQIFLMMEENLLDAKVIRNKYTGLSQGYGFLEFGDEVTATRVLHKCNGKPIPNTTPPKRLKLNHASQGKDAPQQKEYSLFVAELSADVDDYQLYTAFNSKYPSVKSAKVMMDDHGLSKGYGFVRFTNEADQQKALREMQYSRKVGKKPIRLSLATGKKNSSDQSKTDEGSTDDFSDTTSALMEAATAAALAQYYQQYTANYDYQSYYAAWQSYQQQYYGYSYNPAAYTSSAAYSTSAYPTPAVTDSSQAMVYQEEPLEEYDTTFSIEQFNEELMERNKELFEAMDSSRWWPTANPHMPLVPEKYYSK